MIEQRKVTVFQFMCEECPYKASPRWRMGLAEMDEHMHKSTCGQHKEQHTLDAGYRGILGGANRYCVCGTGYVSDSILDPFKCPKDTSEHV